MKKINLLYFFISIIIAILLFPNFYEFKIYPIDIQEHLFASLDISWAVTQNYANIKDIIWGKDFVFTFGPLAPLSTRITWGESKIAFILFDLFYFINIFLITYFSFKKHKNKILFVLSLFSFVLVFPSYLGSSFAIVYFFILIFWIFKNLEKPTYYNFGLQYILLFILFYTKFNTGLISLVVYLIGIICLIYDKKINYKKFILLVIIPILMIYISAFFLNVDVINYIINGSEVVSGYNEIMYLKDVAYLDELKKVIIFSLLVFIYLLWKWVIEKEKIINFILMSVFFIALFILYKQAFVRGDIGHIKDFFIYITFLIFCTFNLFDNEIKKFSNILLIFIIFLLLYYNFGTIKNNYTSLTLNKSNYFEQLSSSNHDLNETIFPNKSNLPDDVLTEIGQKTVDTFPWDMMMLYENNLNYQPRPIIQSYTAYTKKLQDLNFNHYNSKNAPEYVLYQYETIDQRYPLFDESKVNLALKLNYKPIKKFNYSNKEMILLKKNENFKPIKLELINEYAIKTTGNIIPMKNIFYEVELTNTINGKIYSIFKNAPELSLKIKSDNSQINDFKISNSILKSGIFSNYFFQSTNDFFESYDINKNKKNIKNYQFIPRNSSHFNDKIRIKEYKITQ